MVVAVVRGLRRCPRAGRAAVHAGNLRSSAGPAAGRTLVRRCSVAARPTADTRQGRSAPKSPQRRPGHTTGIPCARQLARLHVGGAPTCPAGPKPRLFVHALPCDTCARRGRSLAIGCVHERRTGTAPRVSCCRKAGRRAYGGEDRGAPSGCGARCTGARRQAEARVQVVRGSGVAAPQVGMVVNRIEARPFEVEAFKRQLMAASLSTSSEYVVDLIGDAMEEIVGGEADKLSVEMLYERAGGFLSRLGGVAGADVDGFVRRIALSRWCGIVRWFLDERPLAEFVYDTTDILRDHRRHGAELIRAIVCLQPSYRPHLSEVATALDTTCL